MSFFGINEDTVKNMFQDSMGVEDINGPFHDVADFISRNKGNYNDNQLLQMMKIAALIGIMKNLSQIRQQLYYMWLKQ